MKLPVPAVKRLPDGLTFLSALLIVFAFPPWNLWPLLWICLVPWFAALKRAGSVKSAVIQGIWLSYFMSIGGFYWVAYVLKEFGNLPWLLSILGLQLFSIFGQPQFIFFAFLAKKSQQLKELNFLEIRKPLGTIIVSTAALYTGMDWALPKMFLDTLGHGLGSAQHIKQIADIGGAHLLTFLVFIVNYSIWISLESTLKARSFSKNFHFPMASALVLLSWTYGYFRIDQINKITSGSQRGIQVAAIQGNIGDFDKVAAERGVTGAATRVIDVFTQLTTEALKLTPKPQVFIWPETSYPSTFRNPHSLSEMNLDLRVENFVRQIQTPVLFGGYDHFENKDFNAFFFLSPNGQLQTYRKNILLIFGEYIPGAESISLLRDAFPQVGNFGRGKGPEVLTIPLPTGNVATSPIICYEALFPNFVISAARMGSELITNITNDSWFGKWGEPQLHLALTTFRSIESRLPMLRSTNTGISTLITATGEITHPTDIGTQQILNVYVPLTAPIPTLMKLWGDWFGMFSLLLGGVGIGIQPQIRTWISRSLKGKKSRLKS